MSKGLFLGFPGQGHVNPTIGLLKELISRGDEITYYCTEEFRKKIESTGARFISYQAIDVDLATDKGYINSFKHLSSICSGLLASLWPNKDEKYDYMIYDSMINIGDKLGELLEINYVIRSITTFAFSKNLLDELRDSNIHMLLNFNPNEIYNLMKELKKKYGVNFLNDFVKSLKENKAMLNIVFTSKYFQPRAEDFDDKYKFIGPSISDRNEFKDFNITLPKDKKIIFISLGTVANKNLNFYKEAIAAFKDNKDLFVIMSIGRKTKIEDLGLIPSNFLVYNYLPQLELLKDVDFFITHGGMNSTSEGLYNKIPLIVVPQFGDQFIVAKRVAELKAGIYLKEITSSSIKKAFDEISKNKIYRENAAIIGSSLKESGGYEKAADEINNLLKNKNNSK